MAQWGKVFASTTKFDPHKQGERREPTPEKFPSYIRKHCSMCAHPHTNSTAGELDQWLRALTILPKDSGSILSSSETSVTSSKGP